MGLDQYLFLRDQKRRRFEPSAELFYWRKFWALQNVMRDLWGRNQKEEFPEIEEFNGSFIEITLDLLDEIENAMSREWNPEYEYESAFKVVRSLLEKKLKVFYHNNY